MANGIFEKFKYFLGFEAEEDEIVEENLTAESEQLVEEQETLTTKRKSRVFGGTGGQNRVVNIHNNASFKIDVYQPHTYEDAVEVVECLRSRRPVIVNLEAVDAELARKVFDFLSGALCAIDGRAEKISKAIFLMAPNNVEISNVVSAFAGSAAATDAKPFNFNE